MDNAQEVSPMTMTDRFLIALCFFILVLTAADPVTAQQPQARPGEPATIENTCPICRTKFKTTYDQPGQQTGIRLDLKPVGIPAPLKLPTCPKDDFIVFKMEFTADEAAIVKRFVSSDTYKTLTREHPSYYVLAKIFEELKRDSVTLGRTYLEASWQVDTIPARSNEYLGTALKHLEAFLSTNPTRDIQWETAELISGEIERRLGQFEKARIRFVRIQKMEPFTTGIYAAIISQQLELIGRKDDKPHVVPTVQK